ncbi:MAG: pectate lyase-like adhesive domain-containing protein [Clostridium sp.]|nr:pectate lyase-like adhesive domain-containing protein [Clostridium sp.]
MKLQFYWKKSGGGSTKLTIEGTIHQIGDNYTVKAAKEDSGYTVVEDLSGILTKGVDKSGNSFYNTNSREGQAPELPNESLEAVVEVKTAEDFIAAIENPNVDILNIKADIVLPSTYNGMSASHEIFKDKKIIGNDFKITTENNRYVGITVNSTLIIEDLNLEYMSFSSYSGSVTGKNITTYESVMVGNISLDKVNMTKGALNGEVTISNGKLNKTMLNPSNGALSLTNVEVDALSYGICAHSSEVYLENVKIKNSEWAALELQSGSTAVLKGEIVFENISNEAAILLKKSDGENSKLTIEGTIHQIGDKYTIKAEKEEVGFTIVEDLNGILTKGVDKQGNSYFNTNSREGQEPELPNESLRDVVEVKSGEDFIAAIENPKVHTLDIKSDIVLNNTSNSMNQSYEVLNDKKIIGNGFEISTGGRYVAIKVRSTLEIKDAQLNNVGFNGYYGKIFGEDLNCYEAGFTGNVTLDSITMVKGSVEGALKISRAKLKNTMVSVSYGSLDFNEVEIDGGTTFGIWASSVEVNLNDVKIKNTEGNGLELTGSSKTVLEGDIVFENIGGTTAIELKNSGYGNPKLTVNGEIYQSGDNYTIKADKEIIGMTEVIVDEKAFDFGTDFRGNTYYNTGLRDGNAPEITKAVYPIKTQSKRIVGEAEPNTRVKAEIISSKNRSMSNQLGEAIANGKGIYKIELESELPIGERIIITSIDKDGKVVGSIEGIVEEGKDSIDDSYFDDSVVEEVNTAPKINVSNEIKLYRGDKFEPLKHASATDNEDGDISESLSIKKHNVPLDDEGQVAKAGNYNVFYQVKDSKGLLTTKVVSVAVGEFRTGWIKEAGKWYYFNKNGEMHKGWLNLGGTWYYLKDNGEMATGWLKIGGTWYYLQPGGQMATGWLNLGGTWYYLQPGGQMATGWQRVSGKWYYMNIYGAMETGWLRVNSSWYYLNAYGEMVTGWAYINNNWYYMYISGVMATNTVINGWKIDAYGIARQ